MSKNGFSRGDPDVRRQSLIDAAVRILARDGAAHASVRAIAVEAGVSPGLVHHYFDGVEALIADAYTATGDRVRVALAEAVAGAGPDPHARARAYVVASFAPPIADRALLATWIAFWSLSGKPAIAARHDAIYRTYRDDLEALLKSCGIAGPDCRLAAIAITALVDGLWLELCLSPTSFTPAEAEAIADRQLQTYLPRPPSTPRRDPGSDPGLEDPERQRS